MTTQEKVNEVLTDYVDYMKQEGAILKNITVENLDWALENCSVYEIETLTTEQKVEFVNLFNTKKLKTLLSKYF